MDRRYFLIADLRWEFSMLCTPSFDTVTEENAKFDIRRVFKIPFEEKFILAKLFSYVHMGDVILKYLITLILYKHQKPYIKYIIEFTLFFKFYNCYSNP